MDDRARSELDQRGLISRGRFTPEFDDVAGAVVRPDHELYGWVATTVDGRRRTYGVLAGVAYHPGFPAPPRVRDERGGTAARRARRGARRLPHTAATRAAGRPRTVVADYEACHTASARPGAVTRTAGPNQPEVDALQTLLTQPRLGAGSLYSASRRTGVRVRGRRPVNYIDTREGRWLLTVGTANCRRWAAAVPATDHLIASGLSVPAVAAGQVG